jgi:hypothetical protein
MSLLARLDNKLASVPEPEESEPETAEPETTEPETTESEPEVESEEPEPEAGSEEPEPEAEPEAETTEAAAKQPGATLDPKAVYQVGDETLTGEELASGHLRQADYTRKTQALADREKKYVSKIEELEEQVADFSDWAKTIQDHEEMRHELETAMPETFAKLRDLLLDEAVAEAEMTDGERRQARENRKLKDQERLREKLAKAEKTRQDRKAAAQKTTELRRTYNEWTKECMEEAGLDPKKAEHVELLHAKVTTYRGQWGKDTFMEAAKLVAKAIGVKKKAAPAPAAKPDKKAEAELPPVRSVGGKKPADTPEPRKAPPARTAETIFQKLRRNHGLV